MEYVGIYNRCSTQEESQVNALDVQVKESVEILRTHPEWCLVEQYVESQSGTKSSNRKEYQRMLSDMEAGRFTIIMIKSIDRLARNTRDWYLFLDKLLKNKVRLYIYLDGKFYTSEDSLLTGIKAILAEEFSRELSKKIKNAHRRRQNKQAGLNITGQMYGWNKVVKDVYEINEEEAFFYRKAFDLAKEGLGYSKISNALYEMGARSRSGGQISPVQWRKMLLSPRAHGTMLLHKEEYDFEQKKRRPLPKEEWIAVENALPAIVSKQYQEEVWEVLYQRQRTRK